MLKTEITTEQLHILRHSLGIRNDGSGYECFPHSRNYYASDPNPDLIALCELGLMADWGEQAMWGGMHGYQVTERGKEFVKASKPEPVRLSRSKQRYQEFLQADCGMNFRQWLICRFGKPKY